MIIKQVVQQQAIDWVKSQGMWAVLFIGLVMWAKPHADRLIEAHVTLIKTLDVNQTTISKAIVELKELFREAKLMREVTEDQAIRETKRDNRSMVAVPSGD